METIEINQALPQIKQLLEIAATGEEIIITKNNQPMVKLTSIQPLNQDISFSKEYDETLEDLIKQSTKQDQESTPDERTKNWLAFLETLPKQTANLPDEALPETLCMIDGLFSRYQYFILKTLSLVRF